MRPPAGRYMPESAGSTKGPLSEIQVNNICPSVTASGVHSAGASGGESGAAELPLGSLATMMWWIMWPGFWR